MNISRLNFSQTLPLVQKAIRQAHFLSFDLEMSGIMTQELTSPSILDSIQLRYEKQKQTVSKFIPLQFGLSAFHVQPTQNKIIASPFNFYIFPMGLNNDLTRFSFHAGTMNFLTKNNFDFNKLFYESIPFASEESLQLFQKNQKTVEFKRQLRKLKQLQSPEAKAFIAINLPTVNKWIQSEQTQLEVSIKLVKYQSYMILKEKIEQLYPHQPLQFSFDNQLIYRRNKMVIRKCSAEEKFDQKLQSDFIETEELLFNKVLEEMVASRKPLIVHNGYLDLMHVYYRFVKDLPREWNSYRRQLLKLFPTIYDNKYLFANSPTLFSHTEGKMTSLECCYLGMRNLQHSEASVTVEIDPDFSEYQLDNLQCHEAGFDSLMTGYSFLKGVTILNHDLNLLTNDKAFAEEHKLIKNRIPQGSIKVPFNLEETEDIYIKDGNTPFHFKSILHQTIAAQQIEEYFSNQFGAINLLWTTRDMSEFCIIFLSEKGQKNFEDHLTKETGNFTSVLFTISNVKYLVLSNEQQQKLMRNFIGEEAKQVEPTSGEGNGQTS